MVDAEREVGFAVVLVLAVLALDLALGVLVGPENILRAEIARAEPVDPRINARHILGGYGRDVGVGVAGVVGQGLGESGADVAGQRVVAGHRLVGPLDDDDVLFASEGLNHGGFGEGADNVEVDRAQLFAASLFYVVDRRLYIFGGGS